MFENKYYIMQLDENNCLKHPKENWDDVYKFKKYGYTSIKEVKNALKDYPYQEYVILSCITYLPEN